MKEQLEVSQRENTERIEHLKITFLVENTIYKSKLIAEHGLSVLCEGKTNKGMKFRYLFDTGPSEKALTNNIKALNIEIKNLDAIILSHGHYDHTGGLSALLKQDFEKKIDIICHPDALNRKAARENQNLRNIGLTIDPDFLKTNQKISLILTKKSHMFSRCIVTTGEIERLNAFESVPEKFRTFKGDKEFKDDILDDQALIFILKSGLLILCGCSHSGIINTINKAISITNIDKIVAVFGGFHLIGATSDVLQKSIKELENYSIEQLGPCHCTGQYAGHLIMGQFPNKYKFVNTGSTFQFS